jgi:pyruvate,water dikinase
VSATAHVVPLDRASRTEPILLGPKARNLATLMAGGVAVPDGFVVTASAWREFLDGTPGLAESIERELAPLRKGAFLARLREASRRIDALEAAAKLPVELERAVRAAYERLGRGPVAVRSSAAEEDRADRSAAGLFKTVLDVRGEDALLRAIRDCWASLHGEAALAYRLDHGRPPGGGAMAVVVQRMVAPEAAGVLFTRSPLRDPARPDEDVILIEAVPGRGRELVDGEANPVRYEIARGSEAAGAPSPTDVRRALLSGDVLSALGRAARRVEELLGPAVDVEWAICEGRLAILQARPITTGASGLRETVRWTAANTQEALPDPVAPLTWSVLTPLVERGRADLFRAAGFREIEGAGYMRLIRGRPYFNPDYFRKWLRQVPGAPENIFDALIFGEGKVEVHFRVSEFDRRTFRQIALLVAARVAARERFELFLRSFSGRVNALATRDLAAASDDGLLAIRREALSLAEAAFRRHVLGTTIAGASYLLLDLFLKNAGVEAKLGEGLVARLTAGARGNVLTQANERLHELAEIAHSDPALGAALGREPVRSVPDAIAELGRTGRPAARSFLERWRHFLDEHGHRAEREAELSEPRWAEDPSAVISVLRSYLASPEHEPPRAREHRLARAARSLALQCAAALRARSRFERIVPVQGALFWLLYREARRYAPYRENLKAAALRALFLAKRVFLEEGKRFARRELLERADDVFYLELDEVDAVRTGRADLVLTRALVAARRAERARWRTEEPPPFVLESPGEELRPLEPAPPPEAGALAGVPVSQGRVTARARVLRSLDEAPRLHEGEIIVARVVNAAWTPLFVLAGGIVAEMGGALSHGAIVAREYGIPAVFGVTGALSRIRDGETLTIDADRGTVTIAR